MACFLAGESGAMCAVVCDGAGSAEYGGEGASVICRTLSCSLREHFRSSSALPGDEAIWAWVDQARDRIGVAAERRGKKPRAFASTLLMLVFTKNGVLTAHVGDGAIVGRGQDEKWQTLTAPAHGEYASTTFFLTDDPAPQLRISRFEGGFDAFAIFSDGIENLVLDHQTSEPHAPFFRSMLGPLDNARESGRNIKLSSALSSFLNGSRVCSKTDDDKTLLLLTSK